jgi:MFS family permease
MWRLGFFFHEMSFGLLSVFLPLHVIAMGGSLVDVGVFSATALFLAIPASFLWGYVCDKTRRYKRYILISFLASAVFLYLFTITVNVVFLIILYAVMSVLHVAHEPPKNVLIAELYSRAEWERAFAFYEGFTEVGWLIGLILGFLVSINGISGAFVLLLTSILNVIAFLISVFFVVDPLLVFERRLVNIEKTIDFTSRGVTVAFRVLDGLSPSTKIRRDNRFAFCSGLILFSVATSMLFTPLPIFLSQELALPASMVFAIYVLNSCGGALGYVVVGKLLNSAGRSRISRTIMARSVLAFLLIFVAQKPEYSSVFAATILILMGFVYALFLVLTLSLSMELISAGKAGLFNVLMGIGGASGSFLGPLLAQMFGFSVIFLTASVIFFFAYITFKIFM